MRTVFMSLLFTLLIAVVLALCSTAMAANCGVYDLPKDDQQGGGFFAQITVAPMQIGSQVPFVFGDTTVSVLWGGPIACQTDGKNGALDGTGHILPWEAQLVYAGQQPAYFPASHLGQGMGCDPVVETATRVVVCTGSDVPSPYLGQ